MVKVEIGHVSACFSISVYHIIHSAWFSIEATFPLNECKNHQVAGKIGLFVCQLMVYLMMEILLISVSFYYSNGKQCRKIDRKKQKQHRVLVVGTSVVTPI